MTGIRNDHERHAAEALADERVLGEMMIAVRNAEVPPEQRACSIRDLRIALHTLEEVPPSQRPDERDKRITAALSEALPAPVEYPADEIISPGVRVQWEVTSHNRRLATVWATLEEVRDGTGELRDLDDHARRAWFSRI